MGNIKMKAEISSTTALSLIIFFSALSLGLFIHAFLHPERYPFRGCHIVIGTTTVVLSTLLVMALILRTQQLSSKLKEKELLQAKIDWENTFNTITDFVSVHDKDFKVIKVNHSLCEFLGKSPGEILGKLCYKLFHNLDEPYENCPHLKASKIEHPVTEIISDPNIGVPLQITCAPFFYEDGTFKGSVHMARVQTAVDIKNTKGNSLIPICASCKNIRENDDNWIIPEEYFMKEYDSQFTHTMCKDCQKKLYSDFM